MWHDVNPVKVYRRVIMTYLMALSWLVYGGDVERMGDRDYSTRAAA